jgi:hypothetical protein
MEALGIEYLVENGEVISLIDYDKFENFMFWRLTKLIKKTLKKLTVYGQLFAYTKLRINVP